MSSDLQPALQMTLPSGALDAHMLILFGIMLLAGLLGGAANYFLAERTADTARNGAKKYLVLGVVAALTVPMFLNMISSTLLEGARTKPVDFYTFAGFCLFYVVASRRFAENVAQRLMGQFDQVKSELKEIREQKAEPVLVVEPAPAAKPAEPAPVADIVPEPKEILSYNDIEILRALVAERFVYGNLVDICERTGLNREFVGQRLSIMKSMGVIETRINDKNVLHWVVATRGKAVLGEILSVQEDKKSA